MGDDCSQVQEAIELQRGAIAAEIHDSLIPYIFAARMRLETLLSHFVNDKPIDLPELQVGSSLALQKQNPDLIDHSVRELGLAIESLQDAMLLGRELISQLYPSDMSLSWHEHLTNAFDRLAAHDTSRLTIEGDLEAFIEEHEQRLAARRIAQEAVRNAVRHGKASEVKVITSRIEPRELHVMICDNGNGFEPVAHHLGFGLRIMQMRATQVGATVSIDSRQGGPTTVTLRFCV